MDALSVCLTARLKQSNSPVREREGTERKYRLVREMHATL